MTHHPDKAREAAADDRVTFAKDIFEIVEGRCNKPGTIRELILARLDAFLAASLPADEKIAEIRTALQDIEPGVWTIGLSSIHSRNGEQTIADHIPDTGTLRFLANSPRFVGDLLAIVTALSAKLKEQKAAHAKMLRDEAELLGEKGWLGRHGLRRLAKKIEGGE